MQYVFAIIFIIAFISMFVLPLITLYFHIRIMRIIKAQHPDIWESLGAPSVFSSKKIGAQLSLQRFIWKREYSACNDQTLISNCQRLTNLYKIYIVLFCIAIIFYVLEYKFIPH